MRKFIFIYLIFFLTSLVNAQEKFKAERGVEVGLNLDPFVTQLLDKSNAGFAASLTADVVKNLFFVAQGGINNTNYHENLYNYISNGNYLKTGFEYNIYKKNDVGEHNYLLFGLQYGFASLRHRAPKIIISDANWGDYTGTFDKTNVKAQWITISGGVKAEVFKHISMGWSGFANILTSSSGMDKVKPYNIPGYGRGYKKVTVGFSYSIFYKFPFY